MCQLSVLVGNVFPGCDVATVEQSASIHLDCTVTGLLYNLYPRRSRFTQLFFFSFGYNFIENYRSYCRDNLTRDVSLDTKQLSKFRKSSTTVYRIFFWRILQHSDSTLFNKVTAKTKLCKEIQWSVLSPYCLCRHILSVYCLHIYFHTVSVLSTQTWRRSVP